MRFGDKKSTAQRIAEFQQNYEILFETIDRLETDFKFREADILAFISEPGRFDRLRKDAANLVKRFPNPNARPPLFGLLIGVKDIFHVEGFPTQAGSKIPAHYLAGPEAKSITAMKKAGALILGKTVTTEFAYFAPGPTRNPYNPKHTPGGSSSGSAAAVSAGLVPFAFGTQTIGSIIRPASFCGVVGFKPTYDRISKEGVIPLASSVDHIGFFTPDVDGANLAAASLCQNWQKKTAATQKPTLGIPEGPYLDKMNPVMEAHFRSVSDRLKNAGYIVKSIAAMADFEEIYLRHNQITAYEAAQTHKEWFPQFPDRYHPKTAELILRGQSIHRQEYLAALDGREKLRNELTALMDQNGLDLWISPPARGEAPIGLDSTGDPIMNLPWTHCGFPTLNLPAGQSPNGLPLGLQISARYMQDESLLTWCQPIESVITLES